MAPPRRTTAEARSQLQQQQQTQQGQPQPVPVPQTVGNDSVYDEGEVNQLLDSLSEESKSLVKILTLIITKQFKTEIENLKSEVSRKDNQLEKLTDELTELKTKVQDLELNIENVDLYERRDTIIISGQLIPEENRQENTNNIIINVIKENLRLNISDNDINVSHRIGSPHSQRKRPIIVKLANRSLKYDLIGACIQLKPQLHINESLTPRRLHLFKQVLNIRRSHREKFQQCHTKEGKIIVKLKNSTMKHEIVDERTLLTFLDKYPLMKTTYLENISTD